MDKDSLLEWQRKLDPSHFNKARGAQYHTAPTVVFPDAAEYPKRVPKDSVSILFYIDSSCWIGTLDKKTTVKKPEFIEKPPRGKSAKHGPVIILSESAALAAVVTSENYYWAAQVMSLPENEVLRATFTPGKVNKSTGKAKIKCLVTFLPHEKQ